MANRNSRSFLTRAGIVVAAAVVAFLVLNAFCLFYYTLPAHVENPDGATDYSWESDGYFAKVTEGFSWGCVDDHGFNNLDGEPGNVSVLIMGSSHMEAMQVAPDKNCAYLLDEMLAANVNPNDPHAEKGVYNIGMSGHTLLVCIDDLDDAVKRYDPDDAIVIETATVEFSLGSIEEVLDGSREEIASANSGIASLLQRIPLARLLYAQVEEMRGGGGDAGKEAIANAASVTGGADADKPSAEYVDALERLMALANNSVDGKKLIILYHPTVSLSREDGIVVQTNPAYLTVFAQACEDNGIVFLDMTDRFLDAYSEEAILPHGFANTSVGAGHLNENGHRMCAEAIRDVLDELGVV